MVKEAESHAGEDKTRREGIEKKNQLDSMIYQAEKTLSENSEKLDESEKKTIEELLTVAREDLESDDTARIDAARQRVEAELHKLAEKLYKAEAGSPGPQADPASGADPGGQDDDVIDAEYTEEKSDS